MHRRVLGRSVPLVLTLLGAAACGLTATQRAAVRTFSQATAALGEAASGQFVQMRDEMIRMNTARSQLSAPGEHGGPLEGSFSVDAVVTRTKAANTLRNYGELLHALVEDTQEKELQTASDKFVASVRGLPGTEKKLSDAQLAAMGKLVQMAGAVIVEAKKKEAIRRIVPEADPQVAALCDLLAADFKPAGDRLGADYMTTADDLLATAGTSVRRATTPEARAAATAAYQLAVTSRARRNVLASAGAAAVQLKSANKTLSGAIVSDELTSEDLKSYAATVQTLVDTIEVLH